MRDGLARGVDLGLQLIAEEFRRVMEATAQQAHVHHVGRAGGGRIDRASQHLAAYSSEP
jgi:hypothetical protein